VAVMWSGPPGSKALQGTGHEGAGPEAGTLVDSIS
jgi:hypothetical protein